MNHPQNENEASSGTSALDDGLGGMPTDAKCLADSMQFGADMVTKYSNVCRALKQECRDADELLKLLRLDPERYRTEGGYINIPKVRAALANPDDYPMMPNGRVRPQRDQIGEQRWIHRSRCKAPGA